MNNLLKALSPRTKLGAPETADDVQYEQDFAGLAFGFIQNRVPRLMPYILGFEVVDREEDGTRAVGMFGAKLDDHYYYVPAFFVASQVRGMDVLFSSKTGKFVPLKANWVDHVLDRGALQLGDIVDNPAQMQRDIERPDFEFATRPPTASKFGSAVEPVGAEDFSKLAHAAWAHIQQAVASSVASDPLFQRSVKGLFQGIDKQADSTLRRLLADKGGPDKTAALLNAIKGDRHLAETFLSAYDKMADFVPTEYAPHIFPQKIASAPAEPLLALYPAEKVASDWSAVERAHALEHGFIVRDARPAEKVAVLIEEVNVQALENPTTTTRAKLLLTGGTYEDTFIFAVDSIGSIPNRRGKMVAVSIKDRVCFNANADCLWVRPAGTLEETSPAASLLSEAVDVSSIRPGSAYIFVDAEGKSAIGPVRVGSPVSGTDRPEYAVSREYIRDTYENHTRMMARRRTYDSYEMERAPDTLQISDEHSGYTRTGSKIVVPKAWKALQVKTRADFVDTERTRKQDANAGADCCLGYDEHSDEERTRRRAAADKYNVRMKQFRPGDRHDVVEALKKASAFPIKLESRRGEVLLHLNDKVAAVQKPHEMYRTLMMNIGLAQPEARMLMNKVAEPGRSVTYNLKMAQGWMGVPPQNLPEPPQYANDFTGAMDQPYFEQRIPQQNTQPPYTDRSMEPGFNVPTGVEAASAQNVQQLAPGLAQAAASGQRDVFDHTVFAGLAKVHDLSAVIDGYVPGLLESLDRLGRLVFLFHWKNDEWAERYGRQDMGDMEDELVGTFKQFGDLVLGLKQRAIGLEDTEGSLPL